MKRTVLVRAPLTDRMARRLSLGANAPLTETDRGFCPWTAMGPQARRWHLLLSRLRPLRPQR